MNDLDSELTPGNGADRQPNTDRERRKYSYLFQITADRTVRVSMFHPHLNPYELSDEDIRRYRLSSTELSAEDIVQAISRLERIIEANKAGSELSEEYTSDPFVALSHGDHLLLLSNLLKLYDRLMQSKSKY